MMLALTIVIFFENSDYAVFISYAGNPSSGGSTNSRSKLREVIDGGGGYWNSTMNTERSMNMK